MPSRLRALATALFAVMLGASQAVPPVAAQAPALAGTWKLDPARSRVTPPAILAGLAPASAPATLHITQPANGTLVIESQINEGHVRIYSPGGRTATPFGQGGVVAMASRWEGGKLVSEGRHESPSGTTTMVRDVREVIGLGSDGALTIEVVAGAAPDQATSVLVYTRITGVGPCESWPTPCKRFK
jgi:hypothetical protein